MLEELGVEACLVEFYEVRGLGRDVREQLGFRGLVALSAVMPDELLLDPSTFSEFVDAAKRGFGAVVGWDMPVEVDIPLEESWRNLVVCLRRTLELAARLDVPVIPLSKGVCEEQVRAYLGALERLGFRVAALHASKYAWRLFEEGLARRLLDLHLREMLERFEQVLVIGVLSPDRLRYVMERYDSPRVSYSGISGCWTLGRGTPTLGGLGLTLSASPSDKVGAGS